ncbi:MAG: polysaccharide deacetylase family protein [Solirubrobacteraceae bacterium]
MSTPEPAYPRDLVGYGRRLPDPRWPNEARLAIAITINYEVGGEMSILHGDAASEWALSDTPFPSYEGQRSMMVESSYEFGSRRGIWRLFEIMQRRDIKVSLFGVVMALERHPDVAREFFDAGHEIVGHGYRWLDYQSVPEEVERDHMRRAIEGIEQLTGTRPKGWFTGRPNERTRRLVLEHGFEYDRDALNDELPYWVDVDGVPQLIIPYSYDVNDMRYGSAQGGFSTGADFETYLRETFDQLYLEGATQPRMMSIGLHERTVGRAGRAGALAHFLDYALGHDRVWFCTGQEISDHWRRVHPHRGNSR